MRGNQPVSSSFSILVRYYPYTLLFSVSISISCRQDYSQCMTWFFDSEIWNSSRTVFTTLLYRIKRISTVLGRFYYGISRHSILYKVCSSGGT